MATAIAKGLIGAEVVEPGNITASDLSAGSRERFAETGAATTDSNVEVAKASTVVIIAVKPDAVATVLSSVG